MIMQPSKTPLPIWHEGEQRLQAALGVAERMAEVGERVIRDHMPDQHRDFFAQLPFVVVGTVDANGDAWASVLEGSPGFMVSPSSTRLDIAGHLAPLDPAGAGMSDGAPLGLLGIDLHTRRRNRMNGVLMPTAHGWAVNVEQSFGNCPRYIHVRDLAVGDDATDTVHTKPESIDTLCALDADAIATIVASDTFFVASYTDRGDIRQIDVSHRGGKAGFVHVAGNGTLTIPDYAGNLFFNTLGNLLLNGKAGLLFIEFDTGDVLQMTGDADVLLARPDAAAFPGAERLWTFRPRRIVRRRGALTLRWQPGDHS
jgi:predicted pyridoxine 5'-phosphate oxidase superfamily flavin-nucleotide-binding protein